MVNEIKNDYLNNNNKKIEFIIGCDFNCESSIWDSNYHDINDNDEIYIGIRKIMKINNLQIINNNNLPTHCTKRNGKLHNYNVLDLFLTEGKFTFDISVITLSRKFLCGFIFKEFYFKWY